MFSQLLVSVVFSLALTAAASPVVVRENHIKLPFTRRANFTGKDLVKSDRARAQALKSRSSRAGMKVDAERAKSAASTFGVNAINGVVDYIAEVSVGDPARAFNLLIDTGSSNTWVGASPENPFVVTSTSEDTGEEVLVEYGSGFVFGEQFIDKVSFGGITIQTQSLGAALLSAGFDGVDGIIGIGPTDLTDGTTSGGGTIPTVTDNAFSLGLIDSKVVGISFAPTNSTSSTNGELIFGGTDPSKFIGDITFVPITSTSPANEFVGIDQTISFGTQKLITTSGIVDTGTTLLLLATDVFDAYQTATGAVQDESTGLLSITSEQFDTLQSLFFTIGDTTFEFTPDAQLFPRALNTAIGGTADGFFLIVSDLGTPSGEGFDFVNGMVFLERFFAVFDSTNNQVGIANTQFTNSTINQVSS